MINCPEITFLKRYRDLKLFQNQYVGEQTLFPKLTYDKMETYYPIQMIDLRFQVDYVLPTKMGLYEQFDEKPIHTNLYVLTV